MVPKRRIHHLIKHALIMQRSIQETKVVLSCIQKAMHNQETKKIPVLSSSPMITRFDELTRKKEELEIAKKPLTKKLKEKNLYKQFLYHIRNDTIVEDILTT